MFEVILSGADAFDWGCDLTLNAETMTCGLMLAAQAMTCELGGLGSFPPEKGNTSETSKRRVSIVISSTQSVKIGIKALCFTGKKYCKYEVYA
jgi:hypothetical protein